MDREDGYYWVKWDIDDSQWDLAYWYKSHSPRLPSRWHVIANDTFRGEPHLIGPKIEPPQ